MESPKAMVSSQLPQRLIERKIVHIDMDCFFAAVEARDNPKLKGLPLVVGGDPGSRGVVATCSYEARQYGVRSAMSSAKAKSLCPDLVFVRPRFQEYKQVSMEIRSIFRRYTELIEPLSLDEAYLDVSGHEMYATKIASQIRFEIENELNLTASAGVAPNKMIAKIASDINKPNGIYVVQPKDIITFMSTLPLRKISGIGPVTGKRLSSLGLNICQDVLEYREDDLHHELGERLSKTLIKRCRGIDHRPVENSRNRKSISSEETFANDLLNLNQIQYELGKIAEKVSLWLIKNKIVGKTIVLKVKYFDFQQITRSKTLDYSISCPKLIESICQDLMLKTEVGKKPIRLIGICVSKIERQCHTNPVSLFDDLD